MSENDATFLIQAHKHTYHKHVCSLEEIILSHNHELYIKDINIPFPLLCFVVRIIILKINIMLYSIRLKLVTESINPSVKQSLRS